MVDITSKLVSTMSSAGINEVSDSTKKILRRKLEMEFGDSLTFFTESRRMYIMPDNLKKKYWLLSAYNCHPSWKPLKKATKTTPLSKQPCHCESKLNPFHLKTIGHLNQENSPLILFTFHHLYRNFCTFYWVEEKMALLVLPGWLGQ